MAAVPEQQTAAGQPGNRQPSHGRRIFLIWLVLALAADLLLWFVLGPHLPPGTMSSSAAAEQGAIKVMSVMSAPVVVIVLVYFGYALVVWRQRDGDAGDGPALYGHTGLQTAWIIGTTVIVLVLAGFGIYSLDSSHGAGSGEGPAPIWKPPGNAVQVQVIAQQWRFTYRYPQYGGFETTYLELPKGRWIQFNVTSLDVIHSFWAYQLGVKADANPGVNNVAFTKPMQLGPVTVRCAELCGLWHGAMYDYGKVVTPAQFTAWATTTEAHLVSVTRLLPPYATTYDPTSIAKLGKVLVKLSLTGAGGGYYPPQDPSQP